MSMGGGRGIHDDGFRLDPWSGYCATHGTGGNADMRIAAYAFDLPSIREGVDIQDAMLFSKPDWGLDGRPIPFETLQIEIPLTYQWGKTLARHGNTFMLDAVGMFSYPIVPGMRISSVQQAAVAGDRYGRAHGDQSFRASVSTADADGRQR